MNTLRLGTPPCDRPGIDRVVVYVSDRGYIAQALVSASQLAAQPEVTAIADIIIFLVDVPEGEQAEISRRSAARISTSVFSTAGSS